MMPKSFRQDVSLSRIVLGWIAHLVCLIGAGFYQMDMQIFIDNIFNTPLMWLVHSLSSEFSLLFFGTVNHLGNGNIAAIIMTMFALLAWRSGNRSLVRMIVFYSVGSALMAAVSKFIVNATRPIQLWPSIEQAHGSSFPSSHAMASLSLAIIVSWVLHTEKYRYLRICFFAAAIGTGIARIYFGVHRPSDILLSWLIVISWSYWVTSCFLDLPIAQDK